MQTVAPGVHQFRRRAAAEDRGDGARIVRDAGAGVGRRCRISSSVRLVECDRSASGPRMPISCAKSTLPRVWPSCVKTRPRSRLSRRVSTWPARRPPSSISAAEFLAMLRPQRRRQQRDVDALAVRAVPARRSASRQVAICRSKVTGNSRSVRRPTSAHRCADAAAASGRSRRPSGCRPRRRPRNARRRRSGSSVRMMLSPPPSSDTPVVTPKRRRSSAASRASARQKSGVEPTV